jgi:hypothetical protein
MKLEKILSLLNSFEKNSLLKIIDSIVSSKPQNIKQINEILSEGNKDIRSLDNEIVSKVFKLIEEEFTSFLKNEFIKTTSQLDIITDIIIKDGNSLMRQEWFSKLYDKEIKLIEQKVKTLKENIFNEKSDLEDYRKRDYIIYKKCLETAYSNDLLNNQDKKITQEEQSVLLTLATQLELSQEEVKLLNYSILKIEKQQIENIINDLKNIGVLFFSKKNNMVYIADEIIKILRNIRGKEVADKYFRRVLRNLSNTQINLICKKHNLDSKLLIDEKIKQIINTSPSFTGVLSNDIFKEGIKLTERKAFFNEFCEKSLQINSNLKGSTLEEKISSLIIYFENIEKDEKIGISIDGFDKLLSDIKNQIPKVNEIIKTEFELQDDNVLLSSFLLNYNIKPRDIIELIPQDDLLNFCKTAEIKTRGDLISNILEAYKDSENLYLENYVNIAFRDLNTLKENGLVIKEAEIGLKFEELTRKIFETLGFIIDEDLRKKINTNKDIIDILINLGNDELIIIECKTVKESGYNKFSTVSRQLKSYINTATKNNFKVIKSLLVAPEFSDDFIKECGLDYELNLSLIDAKSLINIMEAFKKSKLKVFPYNLLMRDVLIQEERIIKSISK